jgi:hypothetical protein
VSRITTLGVFLLAFALYATGIQSGALAVFIVGVFIEGYGWYRAFSKRTPDEQKSFDEVLKLIRHRVIAAAEGSLKRQLTPEERAGINRVNSLQMLESIERSFLVPEATQEQVIKDLAYFSTQK